MNTIENIMSSEQAKWVIRKISDLPDRAKYRALNSIRFLNWANSIDQSGVHIPAYYCALHASEEAVAAFIGCAKECGYVVDASLNIKDHQAKVTVSLLVEELSHIVTQNGLAIAYQLQGDALVARETVDGGHRYAEASLSFGKFQETEGKISSDFYDLICHRFSDFDGLKAAVLAAQDVRNKLIYASDLGYPTGSNAPEQALQRECQISLGLIWAAIDINRHKGSPLPLVVQALKTASIIIKAVKARS